MPLRSSRTPATSWRRGCPPHLPSCASPVGTSLMLREALVAAPMVQLRRIKRDVPSLVMNEMNSLTHSCIHSLASLAIFAFSGSAVFMIRATGAKFWMLASDSSRSFTPWERCCGRGGDDCGGERNMSIRQATARCERLQIAGWQRKL